jgi:hypothetical protein
MTRTILLYAASLLLLIAPQACKKQDTNNGTAISAAIKANEVYTYDLGYFGDEEGAGIDRQPLHYKVSALQRSADFNKIIYTYQPAPDFTGNDEVVLRSERGSNGASLNDKITITTIRFTISN